MSVWHLFAGVTEPGTLVRVLVGPTDRPPADTLQWSLSSDDVAGTVLRHVGSWNFEPDEAECLRVLPAGWDDDEDLVDDDEDLDLSRRGPRPGRSTGA